MNRHTMRWFLPVLAALSLQLTGCSDEPATSQSPPGGSASADKDAGSAGDQEPTWTLLSDEPEGVPLEAGAYGLTVNGVSDIVAVVRAPAGLMNYGGWTFVTEEPFRALGFMTADRVYRDPCGSAERTKYEHLVDPGPSVEGLAQALIAQKGTTVSKPVPVTVDGHDGLYLDFQMSKDIEIEECEDQAFDLLTTGPGSWYLTASRERAGVWILDVDGERVMLGWDAVPGVTQEQIGELAEMADSTRFIHP